MHDGRVKLRANGALRGEERDRSSEGAATDAETRRTRMLRRAAIALGLSLITACGSLIGFEDGYTTNAPDPGVGGGAGDGGAATEGGAGGAGGGGGQGGDGAACAHALCEPGAPLDAECDPCVADVCAQYPYCCTGGWDPTCVDLALKSCTGLSCCGDGRCLGETCAGCAEDCGTCSCGHPLCYTGDPLVAADCFTPCVQEVCDALPKCCLDFGWDIDCTNKAVSICPDADCITQVCSTNPGCCAEGGAWDLDCVSAVGAQCSTSCNCGHDPCDPGPALVGTCDPCVAAACTADKYCCDAVNGYWDPLCVSYVLTVCGTEC